MSRSRTIRWALLIVAIAALGYLGWQRFQGGDHQAQAEAQKRVPARAAVPVRIPKRELIVLFRNTDRHGCVAAVPVKLNFVHTNVVLDLCDSFALGPLLRSRNTGRREQDKSNNRKGEFHLSTTTSNYNSTKVCFVYFGIYSGQTPDKRKAWVRFLSGVRRREQAEMLN